MQKGSLDERKPNTMQIRLHLNPEGWRVAGLVAGLGGWELPQYSYLSPAKLGLGLSLATGDIDCKFSAGRGGDLVGGRGERL